MVVFAINRYSQKLYKIETSLLINEQSRSSSASAAEVLYSNDIFQRNMQLENKELLLKAFPLIYQTIKDLQFDIEYYIVGNIKVSETFKPPVNLNIIAKSNSIIGRIVISLELIVIGLIFIFFSNHQLNS